MQKVVAADANEIDATVVQSAKWADALLGRLYSGRGDMDVAMHRAEQRYGIPARTFWTLRYRPPREIFASVYLKLKAAYEAEVAAQEARLRHEIEVTRRVRGNAVDAALVDEAEALLGTAKSSQGQD